MKIYNKLVRDKIPQIIEADNCIPITRVLSGEEYLQELNVKLGEELKEYLESENIEELADMLEVMLGIVAAKNVTFEELEEIRKKKAENRGAFTNKIYLESVRKK